MDPPVIAETAVAVVSNEVAIPAEEIKAENQRKDQEIKELEERLQ